MNLVDRTIRYQGAIIRDDHLLLIKHREHESGREYWILPGGGRESDESEEDCVKRELQEETGLMSQSNIFYSMMLMFRWVPINISKPTFVKLLVDKHNPVMNLKWMLPICMPLPK